MLPDDAIREVISLLNKGEPARAAEKAKYIRQRDLTNFDAAHLGAVAQAQAGEASEAIALFREALKLRNDVPDLHNNLGNTLKLLGRLDDAIASYRRALELQPDFLLAQQNLGACQMLALRHEDAAASFRRAVKLGPDNPLTHTQLGFAQAALNRHQEACDSYRRAIKLRPDHVASYHNLGLSYAALGQYSGAVSCFRRALRINPQYGKSLGHLAGEMRAACDWRDIKGLDRSLTDAARHPSRTFSPFPFLLFCDDPADLLRAARKSCAEQTASATTLDPIPLENGAPKIRIAYLSADFHEHATAYLTAELFELHDREKFEIHAISFGPDGPGAMRSRLLAAFDHWHEVRSIGDLEVAELIRSLGIRIAVDLKGYTENARPTILAYRPAPIQVNYLGYPGSMGAPFIDYVLVDRYIVPAGQQDHFTERLVHLPNCYQVNDSKQQIAAQTPSRRDCGLPENGFVFCAFNAVKKFTPAVFDIWMRLLKQADGSVLWLLQGNPLADENLRREAAARGIDARRLVFAPWKPVAEHLARFRVANLFLDTLPYNAHTTASDALWSGLPVLTCSGKSFAARVAGSILQAVGLPELITGSLADYEALALKLAAEPKLLETYRQKLAGNRGSAPLFDCARFTRNLEAAYTTMHKRWLSGKPPEAFAVIE